MRTEFLSRGECDIPLCLAFPTGGDRLGGDRRSRSADHPIDAVKPSPARTLHGDAIGPHAPQEHATVWRIERKEIRQAGRILVSTVLFLERLRVLPKKPPRLCFPFQVQAPN